MSLPRPLARLAVIVLAASLAVLASAGLASAHVGVSSPDATPGGYGKVTFRVPNESDTASTIKLEVQIPKDEGALGSGDKPLDGLKLLVSALSRQVTNECGDGSMTQRIEVAWAKLTGTRRATV